ncbi:MAG: hypothetical protein JWQ81_7934 [Amycolatopsis sp.]|jgi:hypothetical protein|nr:hypothetical protein [Amycolatopsis sp.]
MPLDPTADLGRRAWFTCPRCGHGKSCLTCENGRTCGDHWQYLLANKASLLHLQCPECTHLWSHDTRKSTPVR